MDINEKVLTEFQDLQDDEEPPSLGQLQKSGLFIQNDAQFASSSLRGRSSSTVGQPRSNFSTNINLLAPKIQYRAANNGSSCAIPCFIDGTSGGF